MHKDNLDSRLLLLSPTWPSAFNPFKSARLSEQVVRLYIVRAYRGDNNPNPSPNPIHSRSSRPSPASGWPMFSAQCRAIAPLCSMPSGASGTPRWPSRPSCAMSCQRSSPPPSGATAGRWRAWRGTPFRWPSVAEHNHHWLIEPQQKGTTLPPGALRAAPPVRPSTLGMLTISRSPPGRLTGAPRPACWARDRTTRLLFLFAYRWLPRDHAPCLHPVWCSCSRPCVLSPSITLQSYHLQAPRCGAQGLRTALGWVALGIPAAVPAPNAHHMAGPRMANSNRLRGQGSSTPSSATDRGSSDAPHIP